MHTAFADVLWIVCGLGVVAALWAMKGAAKEWEAYNERGLYMESVRAARAIAPTPQALALERDDEIRQLVEAANNRRARRGEATLDVDAEIARLSAAPAPPAASPAVDPELEAEVRALVELRNQRRERKGQEPLDVEAEIRRELDELAMLTPVRPARD